MNKNLIIIQSNTDRNIKCFICGIGFKRASYANSEDYQQNLCETCKNIFAIEDIELILLALTTYGGYFGSKKENGVLLKNIVDIFFKTYQDRDSDKDLVEKNLKLLNSSLLYGYTPKNLIENLKGW